MKHPSKCPIQWRRFLFQTDASKKLCRFLKTGLVKTPLSVQYSGGQFPRKRFEKSDGSVSFQETGAKKHPLSVEVSRGYLLPQRLEGKWTFCEL